MTEQHTVCIGIDLGTTNSEVACIRDGKPVVIRIDGSKIMPSVVSIDDNGQVLVGAPGVNNELLTPTHTVRCIKRKMGREELIPLAGKMYTPEMIASLILSRLKQAAEEFLGHAVHKAVITVPAFFNEKQREATKEAALLAGLEPLRLLNEPTAAAFAYATGTKMQERCLVYDLGGGTFDVSIVDFSKNLMEVRGSHGDTELGGADFDRLIAEKARLDFLSKHQIDLAQNPTSWARLLRAAEAAKIRLSQEPTALLAEEFIATSRDLSLHLHYQISRTEFEEMIKPAIERSLLSIHKALEMASLSIQEINRIILVGGSTYIPLVTQMIEQEFNMTPQVGINPATVVAMGAAIEAATLSGQEVGPMMIDVTSHSLGIGFLNQYNEMEVRPLIRRNSPIPITASRIFYKMYDAQKMIEIDIYQGESLLPEQNQHLGSFTLDDLDASPNREVHIKIELDRSGLLHVTATEVASNKKATHTVKRLSKSSLKHVNLADLETVQLMTSPSSPKILQLEDLESDTFDSELKNILFPETELDSEPKINLKKLLEKAESLTESGQLQSADAAELSQELALAKTGDPDATERLSNLIYFLE